MEPDADRKAVIFGIDRHVPVSGKTPAQRKEHDQAVGAGTMSRSGAKCPCCGTLMTMEDIRFEGRGGRLGSVMTAVVVDGQKGKEYRLPTNYELSIQHKLLADHQELSVDINLETALNPASTRSISCHLYGVNNYKKLGSSRIVVESW
jgi:putative DNA methylase